MCQTARTVICTKCKKPYDSEDSLTLECPACEAAPVAEYRQPKREEIVTEVSKALLPIMLRQIEVHGQERATEILTHLDGAMDAIAWPEDPTMMKDIAAMLRDTFGAMIEVVEALERRMAS